MIFPLFIQTNDLSKDIPLNIIQDKEQKQSFAFDKLALVDCWHYCLKTLYFDKQSVI